MKHYLFNLTWACQNACPECWMRATVARRRAQHLATTRPLADWLAATFRDPPDVLDIAGGEPLLVKWLPEFIDALAPIRVGISTNAIDVDAAYRLAAQDLTNLASINLSYHPETAIADYSIRFRGVATMLKSAGYPVFASIVDYLDNVKAAKPDLEWLRAQGIAYSVSPFESVAMLGVPTDQPLACEAGVNHLVVGPDGEAWPCLTTLRSPGYRNWSLGNYLDGTIDLGRRPRPCYLACADYYVLRTKHPAGDLWGVEARPCAP